jgi:ribosomal protein S18 acetylase RimI-like enzyme
MTETVHELHLEFGSSDIRVLTPDDVGSLRLPWDGRFSLRDLTEVAGARPVLSVWNSRTGEYLLGGPWRRRSEISTILELSASASAFDLIDAFCTLSREQGVRLAVASEQVERRRREFYIGARFELIEEIIIYELGRVRPRPPRIGNLRFERFHPYDGQMFSDLLALDHRAFPWVWWNSEAEFVEYDGSTGVRIEVARDPSGRIVGYIGTTRYRSWGHLDRIAIDPDIQGRGLGRTLLDYAVMSLASDGARRVGLSTQGRNSRSRALYESYGFRRSASHDYHVFGRYLDADETTPQSREQE